MKLSMSLIKHLEDNSEWEHFRREYDALHGTGEDGKDYANTVAGCLEISHDLNHRNIPYCILGGLAVAFHLHQVDHDAFLTWRGTSDIDLLAPKNNDVVGVLNSNGYTYRNSKSGMRGVTGKGKVFDYVKDDNGENLIVGLRSGVEVRGKAVTERLLGSHSTLVDLYSVPVRVPMVRDLIAMKQYANRKKDRLDIIELRKMFPGIRA